MVRPDRAMEFRAPSGLEWARIQEMVRGKADWVLKKLDWFEVNGHPDPTKNYDQGEEFLFLGEAYRLKIIVEEEEISQSSKKTQDPEESKTWKSPKSRKSFRKAKRSGS